MNFLCDNCKQKYHVADEKVRGRAITRFKCKKCNHIIEFRGDMLDDVAAPAGGDESAAITLNSVVTTPPSAPPPANTTAPRPAPAAPMGRARAGTMTASAVTAQRAATAAPAAPRSPTTPAPAPPAARPRPATTSAPAFGSTGFGARPSSTSSPRTATARVDPLHAGDASAAAILNATETGWYAGIRDLPVGPLTRKELVAKVQAGDVSPDTLVWREGLDDWRPLRNVAELGDIIRLAAQRISGNLLDEMGKRAPAPPPERRGAQVVPLRPNVGAAANIAARPSLGDDDDEATRVTGMDPAIAALIPRTFDKPATPPAKPAPRPAPVAEVSSPVAPPPAPVPEPPSTTARTDVSAPAFSIDPPHVPEPVVASPAAHDELPEDLFAKPAAKAAPVAAPSTPARPQTPAWEPLSAPPAAMGASSVPAPITSVAPAHAAPRAGVSVGLLVLMGGVLIVGVAGGVYIGGRVNAPPPPPAPVRVATPVVRTVAAQPELPTEQPEAVPTPAVAPSAAPSASPSAVARNGTVDHGVRHDRPAAAPSLTAQQQRELAALGVQGGPAMMPPTTQLRTVTNTADTPAQSSTNRGPAILRRFEESRVVHNCWQQYLRNNPAAQPVRVEIEVGVSAVGRLTSVNVNNSPDPSFTQCLRTRVNSVAPIGPGDAMSARTSVNLTN